MNRKKDKQRKGWTDEQIKVQTKKKMNRWTDKRINREKEQTYETDIYTDR